MEESKIRALILEEIQGIINQVSQEAGGNYSPAAIAKSIGEIVAKRLDSVKGEGKAENEKDQDTEIGKDSV